MACGLGRKLLKLIFIIINFSVWAASIVLIGLGSWILADSARFSSLFADDKITPIAGIILGLGCFCFLVGFCGCRGAMLVNDGRGGIYLKLYFFLMLCVVLGELVCGILLIVFSDEVEKSMTDGMTATIQKDYGNDADAATESVDLMQEQNDCCGATNYNDYTGSVWQGTNLKALPDSCCPKDFDTGTCTYDSLPDDTPGCVDATIDTIESNILLVGGICIAVIAFEIIAMVISCCLIDDIKEGAV